MPWPDMGRNTKRHLYREKITPLLNRRAKINRVIEVQEQRLGEDAAQLRKRILARAPTDMTLHEYRDAIATANHQSRMWNQRKQKMNQLIETRAAMEKEVENRKRGWNGFKRRVRAGIKANLRLRRWQNNQKKKNKPRR